MINAYSFRKNFVLKNFNTTISREDFESTFKRTSEKVTYTFNGWDGKSYNGESRTSNVYRVSAPGYENIRFIKVGRDVHYIDEERMIVDQRTDEVHPEAEWLVRVEYSTK